MEVFDQRARQCPSQEEEAKEYSEPEDVAYYGLGSRMVQPSNDEEVANIDRNLRLVLRPDLC